MSGLVGNHIVGLRLCFRLCRLLVFPWGGSNLVFQCVRQYLSVMISEGNVLSITCPDAQCKKQGKLESSEVNTCY